MKKNPKRLIRITSLLLVIVIMCCTLVAPVAASLIYKDYSTVTGYVTESANKTTPIHVYTDGKAAKLRVCTFNQAGNRTSGKLKVLIYSDNGGYWAKTITGCNSILSSTTNVPLEKGNTHYRVYIYRADTSSSNRTNTYYLSVDFKPSWHAWH